MNPNNMSNLESVNTNIYKLNLYTLKRFFSLFIILGIFLGWFITYISVHYNTFLLAGFGPVLGVTIAFILSLQITKKKIEISLDRNKIQFQENCILLSEIDGYKVQSTSFMSAIEIRDANKTVYNFTSFKFGQNGRNFKNFTTELLSNIKMSNKDALELSLYELHEKLLKFMKVFIIAFSILLGLLTVCLIIISIGKKAFWPLTAFIVYPAYLGLLLYHLANKRIYDQRVKKN